MSNETRIVTRKLRKLEALVRLQIVIIIAMLIAFGAFATNIYYATKLGEQIQTVEATYNI